LLYQLSYRTKRISHMEQEMLNAEIRGSKNKESGNTT
jgi:hypothetical protein